MNNFKKLSLTLALLLTAVTGAWASGEIVVTVTAEDLKADLSNPFTKDGVTIKCSDRMTGGLAFNELNEMSTTLGYFTKIEITNKFPEGISGINGVNGFTVNGSVATWTGKASSVGLGLYSVGPVEQFVFTIEPAGVDVTYNDAKTEASFQMPQYDVTATYTIKRDISVDVNAKMGDGTDGLRYRVKKSEQNPGKYEPAEMNMLQVLALVEVYDGIEQKDLTLNQDYYCRIYKLDEQTHQPEGDGVKLADFDFAPGLYALKAFATDDSDYAGETVLSNTFQLFQGYQVEVAAKEFITYYKDEPLYADTETSADAVIYTIQSVSADQATLSAAIETAPSRTPLLIFNNSDQAKTFLLIPANEEPNLQLTVAPEFVGTLEATTIAASTDAQTNYAFNGKQFVWVKNAITVGANKAWLSINTGVPSARITLVFDETTKIANTNITNLTNGNWYDLNGRKLDKMPTKKGVYIMNGRKVVVK